MDQIMIRVEDLKKEYKLGQIGGTTLRDELQRKFAKMRGKEDPTKKIGAKDYTAGETFMALNGVSFEVKNGERLGIIGHNGAGKSTLLKLLSRITAPTEGRILLNGRIASMLEVGTGFHPELTGRENIYMNGAILGMSKAEIDSKIEKIIEFSECRQFIDTPVKRYSSGMYVKLAFSVAAHLDSEIIIMDEVLAVGDMAFQNKCLAKMKQAAEEDGRTVLYVSHNMNTIRQLCERCIVLSKGKIIFDGDVEEAISAYSNTNVDSVTSYINLEDCARPENTSATAFMHSLEFLDSDEAIFSRDNAIRLKLNWTAKTDLKGVYFRMILRNMLNSPVGLIQSELIGDFSNGETQDTVFEFDPKLLADGRYHLSIALYQKGSLGNSMALDHVTKACSFQVISKESELADTLNWTHTWWGSVMFPQMRIIKQED
ncbi:MAG: ABC transporter ATP-binding protein [Clostridia bacterium]|nr:ABC transporter ATP-binding protein [Clostridia bacterium]